MLFAFMSFGQQGDGGEPNGYNYFLKSGKDIPTYNFEQPNIEVLRAEDRINDSLKAGPWRFGYNYSTAINFENSAAWYTNSNGDQVGILKITSDQAKSINLTFENTKIPEGNELYVYNADKSFVLGKFTQNHIYEGVLGSELVPGSILYVEYYVPSQNSDLIGNVEITKVTHGYRAANEYQTKIFGVSGNCNMNVNCPDGTPYLSQRNSAVMLVAGGNGLCSGALINNTEFDGTPYVLTANHCGNGGSNGWVFRFNWQSDDCNNPNLSPSFESLSGSVERSSRIPSDFMLLEITGGLSNGTVPQSHSPFFAGWDRGSTAPQSSFSIHHPSGDIKKISFDDAPAIAVQAMQSTEANSSWKVEWDRNTTTEGGSSGSPLFNQAGKIIGQLWGGNAGCTGQNTSSGHDFYGRIHNSWDPTGSTNSQQLKYWLDPTNSGSTSIIGFDPYGSNLALDVTAYEITGNEGEECSSGFYPSIQIMNSGTETLTSLKILYTYNGNVTQNMNWTGSLTTYGSANIELPWINSVEGNNSIGIELKKPNGLTDEDTSDNLVDLTYSANPNSSSLDFEFYLGCYSDENSWILEDDNGTTLYSGDNYPGPASSNFLVEEEFCLAEGCYKLILFDTYGDGVFGSNQPNCNYDGSMTLTQRANNQVMASLPVSQANFGDSISFEFCLDNVSLSTETLDNKISIYPNPSNGNFKITMDFEGEKNVVLRNITGQTVASYNVNETELEISEGKLSAGMYMVTISNEQRSVTRKIIVE